MHLFSNETLSLLHTYISFRLAQEIFLMERGAGALPDVATPPPPPDSEHVIEFRGASLSWPESSVQSTEPEPKEGKNLHVVIQNGTSKG